MPNDIPPTRSALFTAGLPPWVRAWTVVWTAIAMILGLSGATAVAASAQPAATLGGPVQAQTPARAAVLPDEQPPTGCAFSAPNTGNLSQNICWIDMSTFNQAAATSAAGQPMTVKLTDIYSISFNAKLVNSIDGSTTKPHTGVTARPLPAEAKFSSLGTVAYTGVPNTVKPALYQTVPDMNGSTRVQSGGTVKLDNIVMNGPNGAVNNYGLVVADAESTDPVAANNKEFLSFQSDKSFRQIDRTMGIPGTAGWPPIRACNGTVGGADGLTGLGTNSVRCDSWWDNDFSKNYSPGAVVLAATAPTSFAGTFGNTTDSTSRQGVAFGILLPRVKIDKELTRVSPGDDFTIGTSTGTFADANAASGQVLKTTDTGATDTTASTGWRMLLADTTPTPVTFWEKPTTSATKTANYATKWDCQVNGVAKNLQAGGVAQTALAPGDNAYCKIINTPVLVKKSSSPPTGETVNIGQTITYTLNFENPGTAPATIDYTDFLADVIDDGTVAVGAATGGLTAALNGTDKIKVGGKLPAGGKGTVTYTVTVKDGGNKVLNNYLVPGTTTPPTTCDPATNLCTTHPMPGFTVAKTAVPATGSTVQAGDTITYTVTGANTGKTALTPATIKDDLSAVLNNAAVVPGSLKATVDGAAVATPTLSGSILSWSANLQAGKSVVLTYQVKVNAGVAAGTVLNNKVTGTAKPPTGPDITPPTVETNHSVPGFKLEKTADPISGSTVQAGESIKYTVTGTNTGKTKLDPVKINDDLGAVLNNAAVVPGSLKATVDGAPAADPTLSGTTLSWTGFLEAGKSVVLTYEVKVNDGVAAGTVLNNKVTGTAKPPTGPEITPPSVETNHLVPGFTVAKTADPVSGTNVAAGQTITYTVTGANTGNTTLDPVVLTDDLSKVLDNAALVDGSLKATVDGVDATAPTLSGTTLSWTGALEAGKSVVLTYQVKINDGVAGGVLVNNKVTGTAKPPTGPEITPPPVTTEHPVVSPKIAVVKSSDPVSGSNVVAGQDIKYTLTFTNTGNGAGEVAYFDDLRQVVDKGALSGLTADAPLTATMVGSDGFSVTGTLAAGETKTVTYSVKVNADVVGGVFVNNFVVPGTTPPVDPPEVCDPATQLCTTHPVVSPKIAVVKSSDPVSGSNVVAGQDIKYTLTFSNTGNGAGEVAYFDDLRQVVDKGALSGLTADAPLTATMVGSDGFSVTGTLAAGETKTVTYSVKVNADVVGGVFVNNFVVPGTTPPVDPPEVCDPATQLCTTHPVQVPGFTVAKTADPVSGTNVAAGQTITYTVTGANTGNTTLDPVVLTDDLSKVLDNAALVDGSLKATVDGVDATAPTLEGATLSWTGALEAGKSVVLTYQVKVNDGVAGGVLVNNKVTGTAKPPTGPEITPPPVTTEHPVVSPKIAVVKSSDPVSGSNVVAGQDIKYTLTFTNTGNGAGEVAYFDDLRQVVDKGALSGLTADAPLTATMVGSDGFSVTGTLAAGETKTVTYSVKVNADVVGGVFVNNFVVPGTTPPVDPPEVCDPATQLCTTHPVVSPKIAVVKSSDPVSGSNVVAGQDIKYTLTFSNTGNGAGEVAYFDDLRQVVDKGALSGLTADAPLTATMVGSDGFSVTGTLAAGETKTVTYSVKVNADVVGGVFVNNFVVPGTTPPVDPPEVCDPATQLCTTHPVQVPGFTVAKTADPVSGTNVAAGQTITYTVTGANTGNTTLDPVVLTDDLSKVLDNAALVDGSLKATVDGVDATAPTLEGATLSWTGALEAGKSVVLTYQVKVNDGVAGGVLVNNKVTGTAKPPTGPEITPPPVTTEHPVVSPKIAVVKSSDPVSGSNVVAGQDIKYTLTFTNTGNGAGEVAYFDDLRQVVDKGALSGLTADAPLTATMVGSDGFSVTGTLAAGETKTVTYSVKVNADVVGGVFVNNFVVPGTTPPVDPPEVCDPATQLCTTHPVVSPKIAVVKSSDPVSGSNVVAGQDIKYTLTFSNTGNGAGEVAYFDDLRQVVDKGALSGLTADAPLTATMVGSDGFSVTGTLAAGETKTVTYSVKVNADVVGGVFVNNFVVPGTTPPVDPPEVCDPATQLCTTHPVVSPKIAVVKSSDPVSGSNVVAGQDIKYTLTFSNTGNGAGEVAHFDDLRGLLDDADLVAGSLSADAPLTAAMVGTDGFSVTGTLAAGETKTVTYTVTVKADADRVAANADNTVLNFVVPGTTPPVDPPEVCDPATQLCTTHPVQVPGFTVAKTADPVSGTNVAAGQTITYTVTGANTGNTTLDPVVLTDDLSKVLDNAALVDGSLKATVDGVDATAPTLEGTTLSWTGALEAGKSVVLTYQVKVNDGVAGGVLINNKVTGTAKPPTGPEITPPPVTTEHPVKVPGFTVAKTADPVSGTNVAAGQTITYTVTGANTGNTTLDPVVLTDDLSKVLDNAALVDGSLKATVDGVDATAPTLEGTTLSWTGALEAGKSVVLTYQVKINDGVAGGVLINNKVTGTAKPPTGPEITPPPVTTEHPVKVPGFTVAKTADPVSGTNVAAGQTITYTVTGANTGNTTLDPVVLTDDLSKVLDNAALVDGSLKATVDGVDATAPTLEGTTLSWTGALEAGKSVVLTYQVKVNDGVAGGVLINNKVTGTAKPPTGPEITPPPVTTEHPVDGTPAIEVLKSSDPSTTNRVVGGQEITYTLTFKNVGTADGEISFYDDLTDVLDDAVMTKNPATTSTLVVSGVVDSVFTVTGKLAKGESATVTYTVKVNPEIGTLSGPGFTPGVLNNYLVVGGENPPVDCVPGDALCTEHPVDPPETTTTVPPTTTTTPPVTTEPCVPPTTTTTRMVPTTTVATTTASATTAGDADVTGTEESTTTEETTTEETTTEEVVAEEIVDPCGVTTTTPPTTTPPVTTVPPTTTVPNTTVPVTPTIIIPPIVVVPPIVVPPTVPGQPVPSTVPGQPKPPTANPGQPGQPKPSTSAPQGGTINSGGGAGESGVNTGLLAAGGLVLLLALGTGVVLLTRKRREDGDN
ncbi:membrane protein [Rhodococcus erythropolis]|uniref:isopeptide-forming domain-containing fimbrial protein n=3 Tax=Rhodococcus erythropolis TaxID=1833 RepID=UPI000DF9D32F|nr:isopeptide-forming domain-containing fimbrial protein [Rhodococcus erythropolis]SUE10089.1 membrane protein [Rhodococcus erythropolis]